ncbi:MAG TPA: Rrf2 family transcriptional regulator [Burkholderiaceae bacterium]|nr:Rrf2 family transcriptional regulator [Burkholderiaceae bacterium]
MKLTAFTDYSLRVLMFLAAEPQRRATIAEISAAFGISQNHLTKVVHFLGKRGWVSTVRGKGGGLLLAKPPHAICVGEVVRDTEGAALPAECFSPQGSNCAIVQCCRLQGALAEAVSAFYGVLDRHTLADISRNRKALASILHFLPHVPAERAV